MLQSSNKSTMLLIFLFLELARCQIDNVGPYCDPRAKTCSPLPALGSSQLVDFTRGASPLFGRYPNADGSPTYNASGACFNFRQQDYNQLLASTSYIMFGRVKIVVNNHLRDGLASSVILVSDVGDKISFLWRGNDSSTQVETNVDGKDPWSDPNRSIMVIDGKRSDYHTYEIEWTIDYISWKIEERQARTLLRKDASRSGSFPQAPMQLRVGTWAQQQDDVSDVWWLGRMDWNSGPYSMIVRSIELTDYSSGQFYSYGDTSGTLASIRSQGGVVNTTGLSNLASSSDAAGSPVRSSTVADPVQSSPTASTTTSQDLSVSAKVGIAVGISVVSVAIITIMVVWCRKRLSRGTLGYRTGLDPGVSLEEPGSVVQPENYVAPREGLNTIRQG